MKLHWQWTAAFSDLSGPPMQVCEHNLKISSSYPYTIMELQGCRAPGWWGREGGSQLLRQQGKGGRAREGGAAIMVLGEKDSELEGSEGLKSPKP